MTDAQFAVGCATLVVCSFVLGTGVSGLMGDLLKPAKGLLAQLEEMAREERGRQAERFERERLEWEAPGKAPEEPKRRPKFRNWP